MSDHRCAHGSITVRLLLAAILVHAAGACSLRDVTGPGAQGDPPGTGGGSGGEDLTRQLRDVDGDGLYHHVADCLVCHDFHTVSGNLAFLPDTLATPHSGPRAVVYTAASGIHSLADGDDVYDGPCEVCHTATAFHRNGAGGHHDHYAGSRCTACHPHAQEFAPAAGAGHLVHTGGSPRGVTLDCDGCHDADGTVFNDGRPFATTTVCNACHSPGGAVDGVNDPDVGAKANWADGVYAGDTLRPGKERWCAGCHDQGSSVISGVSAPTVVGVDFGFYLTGHGRNDRVTCLDCHDAARPHVDGIARTYSAVLDNHQAGYRLADVDGGRPLWIPRTGFDWLGPYDDPPYYALCFRCHDKYALLGGPTAPAGPYYADTFRTNFRNDASVIIDDGMGTDIGPYSIPGAETHNSHATHLAGPPLFYDSDADGEVDSYGTCIACHDVHGSTAPAMIRDGHLVGTGTGLNFAYVRYDRHDGPLGGCADPIVMTSVDVDRAASVGGIMRADSTPDNNGICNFCHCSGGATGNPEYIINCYDPDCVDYYRVPVATPEPQAP